MQKNSIVKAANLIGTTQLAKVLTRALNKDPDNPERVYHRQNVHRQKKKGYAPPDWFDVIVKATDGAVSFNDLYRDLYLYKLNCNPKDVTNQVNKYLSTCGKCRRVVGKSRQKAAS